LGTNRNDKTHEKKEELLSRGRSDKERGRRRAARERDRYSHGSSGLAPSTSPARKMPLKDLASTMTTKKRKKRGV